MTAERLRLEAERILRANDRGDFSTPSAELYPAQFNWDSAFAALGYRRLSPDRAWRELETLLAARRADGMIPHIAFRGGHEGYFPGPEIWRAGGDPPTSGITQPPIAAIAARRIFERHGPPRPAARLDSLLRGLDRWHEWFWRRRRDPLTGAATILHPWESGRDNLPDWDAAMKKIAPRAALDLRRRADLRHVAADQRPRGADYDRYLEIVRVGAELGWDQEKFAAESPFRMLDPLTTAALARAERDLAQIAAARALSPIATAAASRARGWTEGFLALWNEKTRAFAAAAPGGALSDSITAASFLAPLAGVTDEEKLAAIFDHFDRIASRVRYLLPSFDPAHPAFEPRRYWRGPVWPVVNRLVGMGFSQAGEFRRAARLRRDSEALAAAGFFEYHDPRNGEGLGGRDFTWTAAVFLDWPEKSEAEG